MYNWVLFLKTYLNFSFPAEREGFEPPEVLPSTVFKTAAIDHSATSPKLLHQKCFSLKAVQRYEVFLNMQELTRKKNSGKISKG